MKFKDIKVLYINCTLKRSPEESHTSKLMKVTQDILEKEHINFEEIRLIDHNVAPGVYPDMKEKGWNEDAFPEIQKKIMDADALIIATPIWLGQKSSEAKKLIERLYGMSGETNDKGQYIYYGKVGACIISGNEDGAKFSAMSILYSLQHVGFTIPPQADAAWLGEIGPGPSYGDTEWDGKKIDPPMGYDSEFTNRNLTFLIYNVLHLVQLLKKAGAYDNYGNSAEDWEDGRHWSFENPEYR